ncbi:hypothetical protein ACVR1G_09115 [Streptococcus dentasini]
MLDIYRSRHDSLLIFDEDSSYTVNLLMDEKATPSSFKYGQSAEVNYGQPFKEVKIG